MLPYYAQMKAHKRLVKAQERAALDEIAKRREATTPDRIAPAWLAAAWKRLMS